MTDDTFDRPTTDQNHGSLTTTPSAASMIRLMGGKRHAGVTLSNDEFRVVNRLYGYKKEQPVEKPLAPAPPKREDYAKAWKYDDAVSRHEQAMKQLPKWEDPSPLLQASADRGAFRHAEADGLRMLAWFARHLQPGEDPVKALVQLAIDAGWDVDPADVEWANGEDLEEADDDE